MGKVETVVFLSLVLDLFGALLPAPADVYLQGNLVAFTIPLPLFPRLIEWYTVVSKCPAPQRRNVIDTLVQREIAEPNGFLSQTLQFVSNVRGLLYSSDVHSKKWDIVLLGKLISIVLSFEILNILTGGLMGSVFSSVLVVVFSPTSY